MEMRCSNCLAPLRLIALIMTEAVIKKILVSKRLPAVELVLRPARAPPAAAGAAAGVDRADGGWLN